MTSTSIRMTAEWSITTVCPKGRHPVVEAEEWVRRITTKRSWVWAEWQEPECRQWLVADWRLAIRPADHPAKTDRAKPSGWASTLVSGDECTIWTTPWTNCAASSLTPIRRPSANYPKSPLCCWPKITSWCRRTRWTNSDESSLTWTRRLDYPFRLPSRPWWPIRLGAISSPVDPTAVPCQSEDRRQFLDNRRPRPLNPVVWPECWQSRNRAMQVPAATAAASLSRGYSISHRRRSVHLRQQARSPTTTVNNSFAIYLNVFRFFFFFFVGISPQRRTDVIPVWNCVSVCVWFSFCILISSPFLLLTLLTFVSTFQQTWQNQILKI